MYPEDRNMRMSVCVRVRELISSKIKATNSTYKTHKRNGVGSA